MPRLCFSHRAVVRKRCLAGFSEGGGGGGANNNVWPHGHGKGEGARESMEAFAMCLASAKLIFLHSCQIFASLVVLRCDK